jgi:DNA primase small subunit
MLEEDFGTTDDQIEVVFSGQRGYHIHVKDPYLEKLGADERKEIVDYITGTGLNLELHNLTNRIGEESVFNASAKGWRSRIIKAVYTLLLKRPTELKTMGISHKTVKRIEENRDVLLDWLNEGKITQAAALLKKRAWENLIKAAIIQETVSVDTVVTTDIHRLIRLPSSLHGKTAFKVISTNVDELGEFDPLCDAIAFKGGLVKIKVSKAGKIKIDEVDYGPYNNETVELPIAPALFFICKGKATLA